MTTGNQDIDIIAGEGDQLTLESGLAIEIEPLKTRALMSLIKIITRGAGEALTAIRVSDDTDPDEFVGTLTAAVLLSIPEAEDETIEFINRMVKPAGLVDGFRVSKADAQRNAELEAQLREELRDPELEDLFTIVARIIQNEAPHMVALGKRARALIRTIRPEKVETTETSVEPAPKTSSKRSSKASTRTAS